MVREVGEEHPASLSTPEPCPSLSISAEDLHHKVAREQERTEVSGVCVRACVWNTDNQESLSISWQNLKRGYFK